MFDDEQKNKDKKFVMLRTLGKGSFGKVKEALHVETGQKLAIKILDKEKIAKKNDETRVAREIQILQTMHHPNLIQLYEIIETNKSFFFLMENATGGELSTYLETKGKLSEEEALKYFRQLVSAVRYMHSVGIAHRDIKPANILLDDRQSLKLIDFGLGNIYKPNQLLETPCGSPCFAAPELISGNPYEGETLDVWSCGVTLYNMVYGRLPFDDRSKEYLYESITACRYPLPSGPSRGCIKMIQRIFVLDTKKRIRFDDIMKDPWFLGQGNNQASILYLPNDHKPVLDHKIVLLTCTKIHPVTRQALEAMIMDREKNRNTLFYYLYLQKAEKNELTSEELETIEAELNKEKTAKRGETLQSTAECLASENHVKGEESPPSATMKLKRKSLLKASDRRFEGDLDPSRLPAVVLSKKVTPSPVRKQPSANTTKDNSPVTREQSQENHRFGDFNTPAFKSYDEKPKGRAIIINPKIVKTYDEVSESHDFPPTEAFGRGQKPAFRSVEPSRYKEATHHNDILQMVHNPKERKVIQSTSIEPQRNDYYSNNWENPQMAFNQESESPTPIRKKAKFKIKRSEHSVEESREDSHMPLSKENSIRTKPIEVNDYHGYSTDDRHHPYNHPAGPSHLENHHYYNQDHEDGASPVRQPAAKKLIRKKKPTQKPSDADY